MDSRNLNESGEDLSRFALPYLGGETPLRQHMEMDKQASAHKPNHSMDSGNSYDQVMVEGCGEWHSDADKSVFPNEPNQQGRAKEPVAAIPRHITLPISTPDASKPGFRGSKVGPGGNLDVVHSSPERVQVGFFPPSSSLEATNPAQLPGSRHDAKVITSPPLPSSPSPTPTKTPTMVASESRPRAESIEDMGKQRENYVPRKALSYSSGDEGTDPFCLPLPLHVDSSPESGAGWVSEVKGRGQPSSAMRKKHSITPSETSNISLAGSIAESDLSEEFSEAMYAEKMSAHRCYDVIPPSTKIVVFDTRLRVKKAFFALVANGIRAAPLWDSTAQGFVGMLTISDFINILRHHYKSPIVGMDELENQTIQMWRDSERTVAKLKSSLVQIDPMQSLYDAVKMLVEYKIHRLPVIDSRTGNALYILTHKRLLHFLFSQVLDDQQPTYMHQSLEELGIGTYCNIATASPDTPLIVALNVFHERRVSALPIVNSAGKVVDIYAKFDVINLASERTYSNLDVTIQEALKHRAEGFEGVLTCRSTESLYTILKRIVAAKVHRLVVVNKHLEVVGVVSLSDILKFLVLSGRKDT